MKCTTREAARARYGSIDFAARQWPQKNKWMGMLDIPDDWFPNWYVLDTKHPVTAIYCNIDMHKPLLAALKAVKEKGLGKYLKTFDGVFNIRMVRGSKVAASAHAYGLAIDINAGENPLGAKPKMHPAIVECFKAQGFDWGGDFSRKDGMHFSYCWE